MTSVFWLLLWTTVALAVVVAIRITSSYYREMDRAHEEPDLGAVASGEMDRGLIRMTIVFAVLTLVWGVLEGLAHLLT